MQQRSKVQIAGTMYAQFYSITGGALRISCCCVSTNSLDSTYSIVSDYIILFSSHSLNLQINKHIQIIIIAPSGLLIRRDCEHSNSPKLSTIINFPAPYKCMTRDGVAGLRGVTSNPALRKRRTCRYLFLGYGKFSVLSVCVHHDTKKCRFLPGEFAN